MNDEYHQTNSQLDHQATPKRESGDGPGQEGFEYVDPSQGEYDLAGELIKVRKVTHPGGAIGRLLVANSVCQ